MGGLVERNHGDCTKLTMHYRGSKTTEPTREEQVDFGKCDSVNHAFPEKNRERVKTNDLSKFF